MKFEISVLFILLLVGCAKSNSGKTSYQTSISLAKIPSTKIPSSSILQIWSIFIENTAKHYGVDERLVSAIISVESGGNPDIISHSNAVGLMQIKASTAGREVYRLQGRSGQPTTTELRDPAKNIDIGTCYIHLLQMRYLSGILNPEILRYATIVSYFGGVGALLRSFSRDRHRAIAMINSMSPDEFQKYVQIQHPTAQASHYLWKVNAAYRSL